MYFVVVTPTSLLANASVQRGARYASGCTPGTGWGMPLVPLIPNIGPTSFNPYDYTRLTTSWVPHDDGVTWTLVDNNRGVIHQVLIPDPELATTSTASGSVPIQPIHQATTQGSVPPMGTTSGSVPIQPVHPQTHQGSAPQPNF